MSGRVVSSCHGNKPVVLAAILVGGEVVTFTDQGGAFSFETLTPSNKLTLVFQETRHRELEKTIEVHPSLIHKLRVVLEYIEVTHFVPRMEAGFDTLVASNDTISTYGVNGFLHFPPNAFSFPESGDLYHGSGKILHSLYSTDKWPSFSAPTLNDLVYVDSKGAQFSIQSLVIGSLSAVGEEGEYLELQTGAPMVVTVSLRIEANINSAQLQWMHLFSYSQKGARWLDHGKMNVIRDTSEPGGGPGGSNYWVTLQGKLRQLNSLWVVGYPLRLSCWVKTQVFQSGGSQEEMVGVEVQLRQSDGLVGRGSFYQHSTSTQLGVGACLKSICSLGGVLHPTPQLGGAEFEAVTPSIVNGIIMGNRDEIMIYNVDKQNIGISGKHPFYPSEEACLQHSGARSGHFRFVSKVRNLYLTHPAILLTKPTTVVDGGGGREERVVEGFCYLKVAVIDCAAYSDVKAVSYGRSGNIRSVTFEIASTLGGIVPKNTCAGNQVTQLKASCVDFTCGTSVHVSAQSRMERRETKSCRYWSSTTSSISWSVVPPSHNLTSFNFVDEGAGYESGHGLYHSLSKEVALMKCYSGSHKEPSNTMDPYRGAAVTFTCLS